MPRVRLGMIQMKVAPGKKAENLARAEALVEQAVRDGAELCVLPEALTLGWGHAVEKAEVDEHRAGETIRRWRELARGLRVYLCGGFVESSEGEMFNSAVLIGNDGELRLLHRKINELRFAHGFYQQGDRIAVSETPWGRVGLMICADGFAEGQVIARALGFMGARIILSPSSWAVPEDHDQEKEPYGGLWVENYAPVAKRYGLWIAGVSNVGRIESGPWAGRKCIGSSLLVGPDGEVAARGSYGEEAEEVIVKEIEVGPRVRWTSEE